jgi:ABC-type multidrug transport system ATPase subunit
VAEVLVYAGILRGLSAVQAKRQAQALMDRFELGAIAASRLSQLSGGQVRLPTLLASFMGHPRGVVLDEPTNELDPANRARLWQFLDDLRAQHGLSVVLTSHNLAEAERYVERAAFIDRGRLVALGTPGELKRAVANLVRLEIRVKESFAASVEPRLQSLPGSRSPKPGFWELTATPEEADLLLGRVVALVGLEALDDFRLVTPSMDDVYVRLTSGAGAAHVH